MTTHGIGGVFFRCEDPIATAAWYEKHLGVARDEDGYTVFGWRRIDDGSLGETVFAPFPADTDYFGPNETEFMLNLRVDDLDATLAALEEAGVEIPAEPQVFDYGKFGWIVDCDDRRVELWEPPLGDTGFTITVPETAKDMTGEWLCEPGSRIAAGPGQHSERVITKTVHVPVSAAKSWRLWTTSEGIAEWLVADNAVELCIGGRYEFYFDADAEPGSRGGEGNKVLSFLPEKMLSFSWNAPPHLEHTRRLHTHVVVEFESAGGATKVTLNHLGWPTEAADEHPQWEETFEYFSSAWTRVMQAFVTYTSEHADDDVPTSFVDPVEPILPVADVEEALERYERLGFTTAPYLHEGDAIYGFVFMGSTRFHVASAAGLDTGKTTSALYCYVDDADSLFEKWANAEVQGRFHSPHDTPYGLREFAWVDPDGNLFRVGSPLGDAPALSKS